MSSQTEENQELRKHLGCRNGIFQLFNPRHFLRSRHMHNSHNQKSLVQGLQYQMDPQDAKKPIMGKDLRPHKENPRISSESSRTSYSSSCSSTFSSVDYNRSAQPKPVRDINSSTETPFKITARKERKPTLTKDIRNLDCEDAVKDFKNGEVCGLSVKPLAYDEMRGNSMKHIDSPRPVFSFQPGKPKASGYERSDRNLVKVQEYTKISKDEQVLPRRFSYDGIVLEDTIKSNMKHIELARLSLDSKGSSLKPKLAFLGHNLPIENNELDHEDSISGTHSRSSSIVTKLMGLDDFSDATITVDSDTPTEKLCYKEAFLSRFSSTINKSKQNQVSCSPRVSQSDPTTPSRQLSNVNSLKNPASLKVQVERAPWSQQVPTQGTLKMALPTKTAQPNIPDQSSSVYGEIEKRITELQFTKSGKNLRALKQILEAMQKTRNQMGTQVETAESTQQMRSGSEESCSDQNSNLSVWKNRNSYLPKQSGSSTMTMKPTGLTNKVKSSIYTRIATSETSHLQGIETWDPKYRKVGGSSKLAPKNNFRDSQNSPSLKQKPSRRSPELERTLAKQHMKAEKCATSGKNLRTVSPRLQQNQVRREGRSRAPSSDSGLPKKHLNKKLIEESPLNRKHKLTSKCLQRKDDQLSEMSSETKSTSYQGDTASVKSESNNSMTSQAESATISVASSTNLCVKQKMDSLSVGEQKPAVEFSATMHERPSPVSVLDDTFYGEDSPPPVKKTSRCLQEDESPSSGEAEWHYKDIKSLITCRSSDSGYRCDQTLDVSTELGETVGAQKALAYQTINPDHMYVNKILLASGVLKESRSFIPKNDNIISSCHLINPEMFHVLELTDDSIKRSNGQLLEQTSKTMLKEKVHIKIIFDMVNEILVRKIYSGRLFTRGKRCMSTQGLLKEVYVEIDHICRISKSNCSDDEDEMTRVLTADMMHKSEDWANFDGEIPSLVLDIERSIFKDLINEMIVTGEILALHYRPKKYCRQLFSN